MRVVLAGESGNRRPRTAGSFPLPHSRGQHIIGAARCVKRKMRLTVETKNQMPIKMLKRKGKKLAPLIEAYFEFNHLKQLFRQGWIKNLGIPSEKCESVADHVWGLTLLSLFIADEYFPDLDRCKLIKMALIHEFGEIYAGDLIVERGKDGVGNDGLSSKQAERRERKAVYAIFSKLRNGNEYVALWEELHSRESREARFIYQMDRLEMAFQGCVYELQGYGNAQEFFDNTRKRLSDPELGKLLDKLMDLRKP